MKFLTVPQYFLRKNCFEHDSQCFKTALLFKTGIGYIRTEQFFTSNMNLLSLTLSLPVTLHTPTPFLPSTGTKSLASSGSNCTWALAQRTGSLQTSPRFTGRITGAGISLRSPCKKFKTNNNYWGRNKQQGVKSLLAGILLLHICEIAGSNLV